jgi:hypothetical protein
MQVKINKVKAKLKQSKGCACKTPLAEVFFFLSNGAKKSCWWRGVDDVNDRPVGNPKRRCDEHSSKFSLSYETKVYQSSRKKPHV